MQATKVLNSARAPKDSGVPAHARDFSVTDRVVLITGAGQGIGREMARQFGAAGAIVAVADINGAQAEAVAQEIVEAEGRAIALQVDVSDHASVEAMTAALLAAHGRIDVLINNAAIFASLNKGPFDELPLDEWDQVMRVNITGVFLMVRAVAPAMRKAGWGRIVNISSDAVNKGVPNYLHYVTSKSALIGMTNSLARELGPYGITVNCIRPGAIATEVERRHNPTEEFRDRIVTQQCLQRGQMPEDLVGIAMFFATPASSFITGQTIAADGGMTHNH